MQLGVQGLLGAGHFRGDQFVNRGDILDETEGSGVRPGGLYRPAFVCIADHPWWKLSTKWSISISVEIKT